MNKVCMKRTIVIKCMGENAVLLINSMLMHINMVFAKMQRGYHYRAHIQYVVSSKIIASSSSSSIIET